MNEQDKKITAANYIYSFYNEIDLLTHQEAQYNNILLEIQQKYGLDINPKDFTDAERQILTQVLQNTRYHITRSYRKFKSIIKNIKYDPKQEQLIDEHYNNLKTQFIIDRSILEDYCQSLNDTLVNEIIKTLLDTSEKFLNEIYGDK